MCFVHLWTRLRRRLIQLVKLGLPLGFPRSTDYIIYPFQGRSASEPLGPYSLVG